MNSNKALETGRRSIERDDGRDRRRGPIDVRDEVRHGRRIVADAKARRLGANAHATQPPGRAVTSNISTGGAVTQQPTLTDIGPQPPTRLERDPLGELEIRRRLLRRPDRARHPQLPHQRPPSGHRAGRVPRSRSRRPLRAPITPPAACPTSSADAIMRAADEILGLRRTAARPRAGLQQTAHRRLPGRSLPGRRRRQPQHEHQRGARQPGHRDAGRSRASAAAGGATTRVVSPNDHVNMAQSTNDTFPTAMRVATLDRTARRSTRSLDELADAFAERAVAFEGCSSRAAPTCRTPCPSGWARSSPPTP